MKILAMDTSFTRGGVALLDGERPVAVADFAGAEGHVALLPRTLDGLLRESGWRLGDVERIGVTLGPGTFSGARIALGLAKGIHVALGTPVAGFSTLEVVAAGSGVTGDVAAILDARRGEVYAAIFSIDGNRPPEMLLAPGVWEPERLMEDLKGWRHRTGAGFFLTGDGLGVYGERFQPLLDQECRPVESSVWPLDVVLLGRLTARLAGGAWPLVEALEPLYIRRADAKEL
ncbi:MAG: tRNA (adenosine(37)-N6)-threonylcarbamoyltransferase complex dimerization subunit type 1 TsaB [Magnetococcales bacterium]|nr:tRNA (adenosine(37)-N6)-threonylcarbamoyltransferase complex dimerization subunit type 1 TsaB [Magnetococcales bacterium]